MASNMNYDEIKECLSTVQSISQSPFEILKGITALLNEGEPKSEAQSRELLYRALEHRKAF